MTYDESTAPSLELLVPSMLAVLRGDDAYERIRRDLLSCTLMPGSTVTERANSTGRCNISKFEDVKWGATAGLGLATNRKADDAIAGQAR
ncbi:MAG: hypothetical protein CBCREVIR_0912, partial [Candidatus Burkholderia crenata]